MVTMPRMVLKRSLTVESNRVGASCCKLGTVEKDADCDLGAVSLGELVEKFTGSMHFLLA